MRPPRPHAAPKGKRAFVIAPHGGLGDAGHIAVRRAEGSLNMDAEAAGDGFVVADLDGTRIARPPASTMLGWNPGGRGGLPAR